MAYIDCPVPVSAARCTTLSMPRRARSRSSRLVTLPSMNSTRPRIARNRGEASGSSPWICGERLSNTRTRWPLSVRRRASREPMTPAPPRITTSFLTRHPFLKPRIEAADHHRRYSHGDAVIGNVTGHYRVGADDAVTPDTRSDDTHDFSEPASVPDGDRPLELPGLVQYRPLYAPYAVYVAL